MVHPIFIIINSFPLQQIMEFQKVKLVKSENSNQQFFVFLDKQVGKGGFGTVYQALSCLDKTRRLVVKIMNIQSQPRRKTIQGQLKILSQLPDHENIVKIIPSKIYSENNYYLFMEYCEDGTLFDLITKRRNNPLNEQQFYSVIYQCLCGYKVLYDKKILHQDIKPENILIRNGLYKLADFGLSIFYEGYNYSSTREGTLRYIAPEKLTIKDYVGNPKSDVYSFGVMFFELITNCHPYVKPNENGTSVKQFLKELKDAKLRVPHGLTNRLSLRFNDFFNNILIRMLKKSEKNRISFQQIWDYVENKDVFANARLKQRQLTKKHLILEYDYVVSEVTSVFTLPLSEESERIYLQNKEKEQKQKQQYDKMINLGSEVADYFVRRRILIYLFDRLARKLIVQQLKGGGKMLLFDRCILELMLITKSFLNNLIGEIKNPKYFTQQHFDAFKSTHPMSQSIITTLRKDCQYVEDSLCDLLAEPSELSKKQTKSILQANKQNSITTCLTQLQKSLLSLLTSLTQCIQISDKSRLVTLVNLVSTILLIRNFERIDDQIEEVERYEKKILMSSVAELTTIIQAKCNQIQVPCGFDLTEIVEGSSSDEGVVFE